MLTCLHLFLILVLIVPPCHSWVRPLPQVSTIPGQQSRCLSRCSSLPLPLRQKPAASTTALYGIPKLFRWLVDLYPLIVESVDDVIGERALAVDYFYLDMNGIIHTCTHANADRLVLLSEDEMFERIFSYTDRLYKLVKPQRMIFLAIDGVAPRAKMNQQRARRFRASKEREALLAEHVAKEGKLPETDSFDSNCITPGTGFMDRLATAFRAWIAHKMETDSFWQNGASVVFSGPDVPGEGEHKAMDFIRSLADHDADYYQPGQRRHCIYGLDADLIMLSLVTHEPFFVLLREKISKRRKDALSYVPEDFELLEVSVLRRMLKQHFRQIGTGSEASKKALREAERAYQEGREAVVDQVPPSAPQEEDRIVVKGIEFDLERIIDDFVFMCFFIGNDFLPCLPHLDIADGSLNLMMNIYRSLLPSLGGYLTQKTRVHLPRLELFLQEVARREPLYFEQRSVDEKDPVYETDSYKDHYYQVKLGLHPQDKEGRRKVVEEYVKGLYWVLSYYHSGCPSWTWYYPYLYGPCASDLVDLADLKPSFPVGKPFTPLLQLLSVLPPQSEELLPRPYAAVMTHPASPLRHFYPRDFSVDANGKKNAWECVVQIPFLPEEALLQTIGRIDHVNALSQEERLRNLPGRTYRYDPVNKRSSSPSASSSTREEREHHWGNALKSDARPRSHHSPRREVDSNNTWRRDRAANEPNRAGENRRRR